MTMGSGMQGGMWHTSSAVTSLWASVGRGDGDNCRGGVDLGEGSSLDGGSVEMSTLMLWTKVLSVGAKTMR